MIDQLAAETTTTVRSLPLHELFDARPTRRVGAAALVVLLLGSGALLLAPATLQAFVLRHLGVDAHYPRNTTLHLELPPAGADLQRTDSGDKTELVLPAGADLHVSVFAEGTVPKEVQLVVRSLVTDDKERELPMTPRPGDRFRHVFRRLTGTFEFHARGGDDAYGDRRVTVRTVHPPQVSALVAAVSPPAYTGQPRNEQRGGAIEAMLGSDVDLTVTTTMAVRSAAMVFLESGRRLDLQAVAPQDDSIVSTSWRGRFQVQATDRYQIELVADNGLRNPNPGTWPLLALQDYAPIGRWLLPEDEGALLLPTALLCVRLEARDDFGLRAVELAVQRGGADPVRRQLLPPAGNTPAARTVVLSELLEVKDLLGDKPSGNDGIVLSTKLLDNKAPEAGATDLPPRIVQIVDEAQLTAHIARLFRGLREEVAQAHDLQQDRRARLEELVATGTAPGGDVAQTLTAIEVGQNRIQSGADRVLRGLMRAFDLHLWNRLEPGQNADKVVELWRGRAAATTEAVALDPGFYREVLQGRQAGTIGALPRCLDRVLAMQALGSAIVTTHAPVVARALDEAQVARDATERTAHQRRAIAAQQAIETALQQLLLQLEEWNDIQDLIQGFREVRDAQRDLQGRTDAARGNK
jgi:hypothetical protein